MLTYKELDKLREQQMAGIPVTDEQKHKALNAAVPLNIALSKGDVPAKEVLELTAEWKRYYKEKHPNRYSQYVPSIENIERKALAVLNYQ